MNADERRFRVARLALFGSVVRGDARPDSDVDILVHFPNFLRNVSGAGWNSLQLRHFLRSLGRESWQKRKMSSEPREYLRHILVEASYLISQRTVVRG
jgi:predicted nucleotidyltransferase